MNNGALLENDTVLAALDIVVWCLVATTAIWLLATAYEFVVRRRHNLTRAETAGRNRKLELDFLKKDEAAREKALQAADAYARELDGKPPEEAPQPTTLRRIFAVATAVIAVITLAGVVASTISRLDSVSELIRQTGLEEMAAVIDRYPVGVVLSFLIVAYHVIAFFVFKKWKGGRV